MFIFQLNKNYSDGYEFKTLLLRIMIIFNKLSLYFNTMQFNVFQKECKECSKLSNMPINYYKLRVKESLQLKN
jgi:hypothetical protein